VEKLVLVTD